MPQYPSSIFSRPGGGRSSLGIAAPTLVKAAPGKVFRVSVLTVATGGTFGVYDANAIDSASDANAIFQAASAYPAAGTAMDLKFPCQNGIVINPGTDGVVSVSYA